MMERIGGGQVGQINSHGANKSLRAYGEIRKHTPAPPRLLHNRLPAESGKILVLILNDTMKRWGTDAGDQ